MTLPATGDISIVSVNSELHIPTSTQFSVNDTDVRTLANIPTPNTQISFNDFHSKSAITNFNHNTHGTYSFVVPRGVTSVAVTVVGAGGGGGSNNSSGSVYGGGGGGSGGYVQTTITVTPGETLTIVVGWGGYGSNYNFNGNYAYYNNVYTDTNIYQQNPGTWASGGAGGSSSISRGATTLVSATGGGGGVTLGAGGAAGSPNGVAGGGYPGNYGFCGQPLNGGKNTLQLGNGGNGGYCGVGFPGDDGVVNIAW